MELKLFGFIEQVLAHLDNIRISLEDTGEEVEIFFEDLLHSTNKGYLNVNTRVKSDASLKEKIIRNKYYQKYSTKEQLFENVPDIIGIRIECRFIQDEVELYKCIKKSFSEKSSEYEGYFNTVSNQKILLKLDDKQPQEQKNGMKIFRIDGKYIGEDESINFELQIKSLVNIFWGEIEHKVIYKNYNYVIADKFYKDIMKSIKNSLSTIDQQLLLISNQFDQTDNKNLQKQEEQLEGILSKLIYDIFAKHMKDTLGVLVDFKSSCEAIVRYVFREELDNTNFTQNLIIGFEKVKMIEQEGIDFTQKIYFEEKISYKNDYTKVIGEHIENRLNEEFQWNLFFRILFAIEPENNSGDFGTYIHYYTSRIYQKLNMAKLSSNFSDENAYEILHEICIQFANCFTKINSVELLYNSMSEQVIKQMNYVVDAIYKNIYTYEQWQAEKEIYILLSQVRILMLFNIDIDYDKAITLLDRIRDTKSHIEVPKGMLKYVYNI